MALKQVHRQGGGNNKNVYITGKKRFTGATNMRDNNDNLKRFE